MCNAKNYLKKNKNQTAKIYLLGKIKKLTRPSRFLLFFIPYDTHDLMKQYEKQKKSFGFTGKHIWTYIHIYNRKQLMKRLLNKQAEASYLIFVVLLQVMVHEGPSDGVIRSTVHVAAVAAFAVCCWLRQLERSVRTDVFYVLCWINILMLVEVP